MNKMLLYFVPYGTVARVSTVKVKGSDIENAAREKWGVCIGRTNDIPIWKNPLKPSEIFRSKDFIVHTLCEGESYFDFFRLVIPAPKVMLHNPQREPSKGSFQDVKLTGVMQDKLHASANRDDSDRPIESTFDEIESLHTKPESFIGQTVMKRWVINKRDLGVCKGTVSSFDSARDVPGGRPWEINWDDTSISYFNSLDMVSFCINKTHGTVVTQVIDESESDSEEREAIADLQRTISKTAISDVDALDTARDGFERQELTVYNTVDRDTWTTICNAMDIEHSRRKMYYQWLCDYHEYGHAKTVKGPFNFVNPYGTSKQCRRHGGEYRGRRLTVLYRSAEALRSAIPPSSVLGVGALRSKCVW
jgi:hypothetical protein